MAHNRIICATGSKVPCSLVPPISRFFTRYGITVYLRLKTAGVKTLGRSFRMLERGLKTPVHPALRVGRPEFRRRGKCQRL
jgi:hypothetical protein